MATKTKELQPNELDYENPEKMMNQIASTNARLFHHRDRLNEIWDEKKIRPITIHLAPTNRCNLDCSFCSTKYRKDQNTLQEIPINEAKEIVNIYKKLGLKSVEITGGGDPTVYPDLEELIFYIKEQELGIGMITNGLRLNKIDEDALKTLDWMRISLAGIEFDKDDSYFDLDPSRFPEMTGSSIVVSQGNLPTQDVFKGDGIIELGLMPDYIETMLDQLQRASKVVDHLGLKYLRVVPNCYSQDQVKWAKTELPKILTKFPSTSFSQSKDTDTPPQCWQKYMKPFINADGYVYQCSTLSLFHGYFHPDWRVGHWKDVAKIYDGPIESFDTSKCPYCFYRDQQIIITDIINSDDIITPQFV
ncbi:MAG: Cyclic pyranopterin monophosphate synthase [Candidatus Heimdallarchaeota archaeon LC_2]|nr:MAG: Cyclic pyranopterin monophosphate synthase [Candidatus Heimdallarchaeota archaeon LC_2]